MVTKQEIRKQIEHLGVNASEQFINLFRQSDEKELCNRANFNGHITASGCIIHIPSREVLLLRHKSLNKWLLPGGHVDPTDNTLADAALREIEEETYLTADQLVPVNVIDGLPCCVEINSHRIPHNERKNESNHDHHDFRFLFGYMGDKSITFNTHESTDYQWLSIDNPYLGEIMKTRESTDEILLEGLEQHEHAYYESHHNDYLITPLASYTLKLGINDFNHGNLERAEQMFCKSIEAFENTYDDEYEIPPGILSSIRNLATVYEKTNRHDREIQVLEKGLKIAREMTDIDSTFSPEVSKFIEQISRLRHSTGQL